MEQEVGLGVLGDSAGSGWCGVCNATPKIGVLSSSWVSLSPLCSTEPQEVTGGGWGLH